MKMLKNEKGFTLIELVLIIVILGILGAVAMVQFGTILTDSKNAAIDGTFGQFNAQLALAINSLKALPTTGAAGTFYSNVFTLVSLSGSGVVTSAFSGGSPDTFGICAGGNLTCNAAATSCGGSGRGAQASYNGLTGALTLATKTNC
ncbi:MAG TPA: type II secretion system protein [Nitrospiria bacterium]|nr:type II secretion system protein [Nitrospiria bacterium]